MRSRAVRPRLDIPMLSCAIVGHMSPEHRRYLVIEQGVGAAVIDFLLNGIIAWAVFRGHEIVPLWGQPSIAGDTLGTTFLLPLLTCLIVTPLARGHVRGGKLSALGWTPTSHPVLRWLPAGTFARAVVLGLICTLAFAPIALSVLGTTLTAMMFWRFVAFKACFAAGLGAIVTPIIALWAIATISPKAAPA